MFAVFFHGNKLFGRARFCADGDPNAEADAIYNIAVLDPGNVREIGGVAYVIRNHVFSRAGNYRAVECVPQGAE